MWPLSMERRDLRHMPAGRVIGRAQQGRTFFVRELSSYRRRTGLLPGGIYELSSDSAGGTSQRMPSLSNDADARSSRGRRIDA